MPIRTPSLWSGRRLARNDLMSQFEEFINDFDRDLTPTLRGAGMDFSPAVDIEESENKFLVTVDLPGMKKEEIKIELSGNSLHISGERRRETKDEGRYTERSYGKFMRMFSLPAQVDAEKIDAHFENGVLHITLPKAETAKNRAIKIQ
jgi:HSP20 family protein